MPEDRLHAKLHQPQERLGDHLSPAVAADSLHRQSGRLKMEVEWLKKHLPSSVDARRAWIEPGHGVLSLRPQCELLSLARGSWCYEPVGEAAVNLKLIRRIPVTIEPTESAEPSLANA